MKTFTPNTMSNEERNILVLAETCAVDRSGLMQRARMNTFDLAILEEFQAAGLLSFGSVPSSVLGKVGGESFPNTHWVTLHESGWALAGQSRQMRAAFTCQNRRIVNAALVESDLVEF